MNTANVQIQRLSTDQCAAIHNASLKILARTGVRLHLEEAVEMLRKAGAQVSEGNLVRIPASLVEKALNTAPRRVPVFDRNGQPAMLLGGRQNYYGSGSDCLNIVDHRTNQRRRAVLQDVVEGCRVCDAMSNVDFVMSMFMPSDVDPRISDVCQMEVMLHNTSKPIIFVTNEFQGCVDAVEMAEAVAGGADALSARSFIVSTSRKRKTRLMLKDLSRAPQTFNRTTE